MISGRSIDWTEVEAPAVHTGALSMEAPLPGLVDTTRQQTPALAWRSTAQTRPARKVVKAPPGERRSIGQTTVTVAAEAFEAAVGAHGGDARDGDAVRRGLVLELVGARGEREGEAREAQRAADGGEAL